MNFYSIEFQDGYTKEVQNLNDNQAVKMAQSILRRWNQPGCKVYRTNPYNSNKKRLVGEQVNSDFNPDLPVLYKDPIDKIIASKPEPKRKKSVNKKGKKSQSGNSGRKIKYQVPLSAIAEKLGKNPAALRRKLRKSGIQKPEGGWGWDSWEDPVVQEILTWKEA